MAHLTSADFRHWMRVMVWAPWRAAPLRTAFAFLTIVLGVALGAATAALTSTATQEMARAASGLYGSADLVVQGGTEGFDERLYAVLASRPEVRSASPVVEIRARVAGGVEVLRVMGMDGFRAADVSPGYAALKSAVLDMHQANGLWFTPEAARRFRLEEGATLILEHAGEPVSMRLSGLLPVATLAAAAVVGDIATIQWRFGQLGRLQRVDLRVSDALSPEEVRRSLQALLPPGVHVTTPEEEADEAAALTRAYRTNLTALSLVSLMTGGFIVFASQVLGTVQRRRYFALQRALGFTAGGIAMGLLVEVGLMGLLAGLLGTLSGEVLAVQALERWGPDLGAGYVQGQGGELAVSWGRRAGFALLGLATALLGSLPPALEAGRITPAQALRAGEEQVALSRWASPWRLLPYAVASLIAAAALSGLPAWNGLPLAGYASVACILLGATLVTPAVVALAHTLLPARGRAWVWLGLAHSRHGAGQAAAALAGMLVSFSLMVAMAIMVHSFRESLDDWLQKVLPADMYLRVAAPGEVGSFEPEAVAALRTLPEARRVEFTRYGEVTPSGHRSPVILIARDAPGASAEALYLVRRATVSAELPVVWVSEAAEALYGWTAGSRVRLPLNGREVECEIGGVWRDYARQGGAMVMDRTVYRELTGDETANAVALWARSGTSPELLAAQARALLPPERRVDVALPAELRAQSLRIFDRTFGVTYLLEVVAVIIGLFGIGAASASRTLMRASELAMLRCLGLTRREILAMLGLEGAMLGAVGVALGLLAGWVVSLLLIQVVNRQSFHWSMDLHLPWGVLVSLGAALTVAAGVAAASLGWQALGRAGGAESA